MNTGMFALALGLLALRSLPELPPDGLAGRCWLLVLMLLPFKSYPGGFFLLGLSWACVQAQWATG